MEYGSISDSKRNFGSSTNKSSHVGDGDIKKLDIRDISNDFKSEEEPTTPVVPYQLNMFHEMMGNLFVYIMDLRKKLLLALENPALTDEKKLYLKKMIQHLDEMNKKVPVFVALMNKVALN